MTVTGSGRGTVVSGGGAISCADTCDIALRKGTTVVLYARSTTSRFSGWSGDCSGTKRCSLPMTSDGHVTATFSRIDAARRLSVDVDGPGRVTSVPAGIDCPGSCSAPFDRGRRVRLVAKPATGVTWSGACESAGACEVEMHDDASVGARFATAPADRSRLHVAVRGAGTVRGPRIDCEPTCTALFDRGRTVTLVAEDGGGTFNRWEGPCADPTGPRCEVRLDDDRRVVAVFDDAPVTETVTLTIRNIGTGKGTISTDPGDVSCETVCELDDLEPGEDVTLTATATSTSTFTGWGDPNCPGTDPCTVTMDVSRGITARFDENPPVRLGIRVANRPDPDPLTVSVDGKERPGCASDPCEFPRGTLVTVTSDIPVFRWRGCDGDPPPEAPCPVLMTKDRSVSVAYSQPEG